MDSEARMEPWIHMVYLHSRGAKIFLLLNFLKNLFIYLSLFVYSYVHTLFGPFFPSTPAPSLYPPLPSLPDRICSALVSNFVEEKT
jgi:hypothetical protein